MIGTMGNVCADILAFCMGWVLSYSLQPLSFFKADRPTVFSGKHLFA